MTYSIVSGYSVTEIYKSHIDILTVNKITAKAVITTCMLQSNEMSEILHGILQLGIRLIYLSK